MQVCIHVPTCIQVHMHECTMQVYVNDSAIHVRVSSCVYLCICVNACESAGVHMCMCGLLCVHVSARVYTDSGGMMHVHACV